MESHILNRIRKKSTKFFKFSHHDRFHTERVYNLAIHIGKKENADLTVLGAAALLHDIARAAEDEGKIVDHAFTSAQMAKEILEEVNFPMNKITKVLHCIEVHRFLKGDVSESLEAKILQDVKEGNFNVLVKIHDGKRTC